MRRARQLAIRRGAMNCPSCTFVNSKVVDSRAKVYSIRRRRECLKCKFRFTTYELPQSGFDNNEIGRLVKQHDALLRKNKTFHNKLIAAHRTLKEQERQ